MALSPSASYPPSPMSLELVFFPPDLQELIPVTESLPIPEPAVPSLSFFFFFFLFIPSSSLSSLSPIIKSNPEYDNLKITDLSNFYIRGDATHLQHNYRHSSISLTYLLSSKTALLFQKLKRNAFSVFRHLYLCAFCNRSE